MRSVVSAVTVLAVLSFGFVATSAHADPKPWIFSWGNGHWEKTDFSRRYLEEGKTPHNTQWARSPWQTGDWAVQRGGPAGLLEGLYASGILVEQYASRGVPVLSVGENFFELGGEDRRRVLRTVDDIHGITTHHAHGMFSIVRARNGKVVGHYTRYGAQFQ